MKKKIDEFLTAIDKAFTEFKNKINEFFEKHIILKRVLATIVADAASTAIATFIRKKIMENVTPAVDPYSGRMVLFWKKDRRNPPPRHGATIVNAI